MDVTVRHAGTGHSCVVGVPEGGTVVGLKADALNEMFPGSTNTDREAAAVAAHIEGCEEELDDEECVADTGLEDGGAVKLVPRWPNVKAPAAYDNGHDNVIFCVALSGCGKLCAAGYHQGQITVFDTITADVVAEFSHGNHEILCAAFSDCGARLATCSRDGTICVWLTSPWQRACIVDHNSPVYRATWTHCGRLVSGDKRGILLVCDVKAAPTARMLKGHTKTIPAIAVSARTIFSGSADKTIRAWDLSTLTHTHTLEEHTEEVTCIALTKDEEQLVSCSLDNNLKVWCTASLSCLRTVEVPAHSFSFAMSQPGDVIAVKSRAIIALYRLSTGHCLGELDASGGTIAFSPCGRWFFTSANYITVSVSAASSLKDSLCP